MTTRRPLPIDIDAASRRRGACPSLQQPMQTGDGLLVRLRPDFSRLTAGEFRRIAEAACRFGNGILEVTARGNLQVRGLREETAGPFADAVAASGVRLSTGVAVETPPLSGFDPDELADPRPLAAHLCAAMAEHQPPFMLAAKLSIVADGGGRFHLGGIAADIRLTAVPNIEDAPTAWRLEVGGDARTARRITLLPDETVVDAVMTILASLGAAGPKARGRDLNAQALTRRFGDVGPSEPPALPDPAPLPPGIHNFGTAGIVLGVGLAFCQTDADNLTGFLDEMERLGATEIRLAPAHGLLVLGLDEKTALAAQSAAAAHGFLVDGSDPRNAIALCAGAKGCASAAFDTRALAQTVIAYAPDVLDGSLTLHLSGCPKGCAHPAAALLTVTGMRTGYGLVVDGPASASPDAVIAANDVISALSRLSALVRDNKNLGETARSCLKRLGTARIAGAMQQE